jgi:hypothetical protein
MPKIKIAPFSPHDVIGMVTIIGCFALIYMGNNSGVHTVLAIVIGFFFGRKSVESVADDKDDKPKGPPNA